LIFDIWHEAGTHRDSGMGVGPIPELVLQGILDRLELDRDERDRVAALVRALDGVFLEEAVAEMERKSPPRPNDGRG